MQIARKIAQGPVDVAKIFSRPLGYCRIEGSNGEEPMRWRQEKQIGTEKRRLVIGVRGEVIIDDAIRQPQRVLVIVKESDKRPRGWIILPSAGGYYDI